MSEKDSSQPEANDGAGAPSADTEVFEVTTNRVADILDGEGLQYRVEDQPLPDGGSATLVRTGFVNAAIAFTLRDNTLICDSLWRGDVSRDQASEVLAAVNTWNQSQFAPTLRFFEQGESNLAISAVREVNVAEGLSRNQIGVFVMTTLDAVLQSFRNMEEHFPNAVTWEQPHKEESANDNN